VPGNNCKTTKSLSIYLSLFFQYNQMIDG
jgi:hypothetical protein